MKSPEHGPTVRVASTGEPPCFFDQGLRFACQRCGHCCTGQPGDVHVSPEEITGISRHLLIPENTFLARYCRPTGRGLSLKEWENGDCVFHDQGCTIYPVRPAQCMTFPFWTRNLRTEEAWNATARACPGIGQGPLHDREYILKQVGKSPI